MCLDIDFASFFGSDYSIFSLFCAITRMQEKYFCFSSVPTPPLSSFTMLISHHPLSSSLFILLSQISSLLFCFPLFLKNYLHTYTVFHFSVPCTRNPSDRLSLFIFLSTFLFRPPPPLLYPPFLPFSPSRLPPPPGPSSTTPVV